MHPRIILASGSQQRKALLEALDIAFEVIPSEIDEQAIRDSDLKIQAEKIARAKAESVAAREEGIVISADTFVESQGKVLEKPKDLEEARSMLLHLSENTAEILTGFCYIDKNANINFSACITNEIVFRKLSPNEIDSYCQKFPVLTWSGGFSPAYPYGLTFFESVSGSPTSFTHGLPMNSLIPLLEKSGIKISPK